MLKEFVSRNEKKFYFIYWGCLLIFVMLTTTYITFDFESTFISVLTSILILLYGVILIFSGLYNWQWAFRFPSKGGVVSNINRVFGFLFGAAAIGISFYMLARSIFRLS
jgi:hypothetical protein